MAPVKQTDDDDRDRRLLREARQTEQTDTWVFVTDDRIKIATVARDDQRDLVGWLDLHVKTIRR